MEPNDVRARVSADYGRTAVEKAREAASGGPAEPVLPIYPETPGAPAAAVTSSLGCGNPLHAVELRSTDVVLDLGCGGGLDLILAALRLGPTGRAIGVDMTPEMIALARRNLDEAGIGNAEVRQGTIEALPVDDASVDWVVSNCVLNLSPEKGRVAREIARVLKAGGRLAISDLFVSEVPAELRDRPAIWSSCLGGAVPEEEFVALLRGAGLVDVTLGARHLLGDDELAAMLGAGGAPGCCSGGGCCGAAPDLPPDAVARLSGRVTSAVVTARKSSGTA